MPSRPPSRPPRHNRLDHLCKRAMDIDRGRLLSLILAEAPPGALGPFRGPLVFQEALLTEFARGDLRADGLFRAALGAQAVLVHLEYEREPDAAVPQRIVNYQVAAWSSHQVPVLSVVLEMYSADREPVRPGRAALGPQSQVGWLRVSVPAMAQRWPEELESPMAVLLRALTRIQPGQLRRSYEDLRRLGLDRQSCQQLLEVLSFLLNVRQGLGAQYQNILEELEVMIRLEDSFIYERGVEKGLEEGLEKGIEKGAEKERAALLARLHGRAIERSRQIFGADEVGEARIRRLGDADRVLDLIERLPAAASLSAALAGLD